jgi:uncharacterized protein (TIGR02145 family)
MKKFLPVILLILLASSLKFQAQDIMLNFTGTGASDQVDSVLVQNLTQGSSLTLPGGDVLHLKGLSTGVGNITQYRSGDLTIYPNPALDYARFEFDSPSEGMTGVEISDIPGRIQARWQRFMQAGRHTFELTGLGNGVYIVRVITGGNLYTGSLVSISPQHADIMINYAGTSEVPKAVGILKSAESEVMMTYNSGDLLKFTCMSGIYSTVIMDTPDQDKTIVSNFVACTDQDNHNYPVVEIGNQLWMAENLRTSHYADGMAILHVADSMTWRSNSTDAYCFYSDSVKLMDIYGALYNWNAVADTNQLCPAGWHLPTDAEWTILEDALGGATGAGARLKETGVALWNGGNSNGDNTSGFSARPGGMRSSGGSFSGIGDETAWWSSAGSNADSAFTFGIHYDRPQLQRIKSSRMAGHSVRCVLGIPALPVVLTVSAYPVELSTATAGGNIVSDGGTVVFSRGICWSENPDPTTAGSHTSDSTGTGIFVSRISGLTPGITYHFRAYASNRLGTIYGADSSFTTLSEAIAPVIQTNSVSIQNSSTVVSGGNVISDGGSAITARGVCWSLGSGPTVDLTTKTSDGNGLGKFTSQISGLSFSTLYHIRAYATNGVGTSYGKETTFSIVMNLSGPILTDVEGNVYQTVYIGNQLWMAENLKTEHFRDGSPIPTTEMTADEWLALTSSALCYYDNDRLDNRSIYGTLYNWYAVTDEHNLCPSGWQVPSNDDWLQLREYLGGESVAGGKMKDIQSGLWAFPNTGADNSSGFTALPGGDRDDGLFGSIHDGGGWWSSTGVSVKDAWSHYLYYSQNNFFPSPDEKVSGCSVRCIKE